MVKKFENFKLSEREIGEVELNLGDKKKSRDDCERAWWVRYLGDNAANFTGRRQTMTQLWCPEESLRVATGVREKALDF